MNDLKMSWSGLKQCWPIFRILFISLFVAIAIDLAVSVTGSFVLSDVFYLEKYFTDHRMSLGVDVKQRLSKYFANTYLIKPDNAVGWVNTPNQCEPNWCTDSKGAQSNPKWTAPTPIKNSELLVFLLGSSTLNGYGQPFEAKPVGLLRSEGYDAIDFSSVMYTIDQSWSFYQQYLRQYKPKAIVVGVHNNPESISNMFVAFRKPDSHDPYMKPAYYLQGKKLIKYAAPVEDLKDGRYQAMLAELQQHDAKYRQFQLYKRLGLGPFSNLLLHFISRVQPYAFDQERYQKNVLLQLHFMRQFVKLGQQRDIKIIFIKFETKKELRRPAYKRFLQKKNAYHNELLRKSGLPIIFISNLFSTAGYPLSDLYMDGDIDHFSTLGNELLAQAINQSIKHH